MDRDPIVRHFNWSPRAGAAVSVLPEGRAIIRGGYGKFVQRTPLNIETFPQYESRVVVAVRTDGSHALGPAIAFTQRDQRRSENAGSLRRQRRVESAIRPPPAGQARVPAAQRVARVHPHARSRFGVSCSCRARARRVTASSRRRRDILAATGAISRSPTCGHAAPRTSITTISSTATSAIRSCAPTRTTCRRPTCGTASSCAATFGWCRAVGVCAGAGAAVRISLFRG